MWRIRRKAKRLYNNLIKVVVLISALILAITLVNRNTDLSINIPFLDKQGGEAISWFRPVFFWLKEWGLLIVIVVILSLVLMKVVPNYLKMKRVKRSDIKTVDVMTGDQFEEFLVMLFKILGYSAKKTKKTRDQGADVILHVHGVRIVVQAKRERNKISNSAIQQVVASKAIYAATEAWVVTNSYYTDPAKELAKANGVKLWDRDRLIAELSKINLKKQNAQN